MLPLLNYIVKSNGDINVVNYVATQPPVPPLSDTANTSAICASTSIASTESALYDNDNLIRNPPPSTKAGAMEHVCSIRACGRSFQDIRMMYAHQRICEMKPHKCPFPGCKRRFSLLKQRNIHITEIHNYGGTRFKCVVPDCSATFKKAEALETHEFRCRFKYFALTGKRVPSERTVVVKKAGNKPSTSETVVEDTNTNHIISGMGVSAGDDILSNQSASQTALEPSYDYDPVAPKMIVGDGNSNQLYYDIMTLDNLFSCDGNMDSSLDLEPTTENFIPTEMATGKGDLFSSDTHHDSLLESSAFSTTIMMRADDDSTNSKACFPVSTAGQQCIDNIFEEAEPDANCNNVAGLTNRTNAGPESIAIPTTTVKALYDYDAVETDELSFKEGDILEKLEDEVENEQGWCIGRKDGRVGLIPATYVEAIQ